MATAQEKVQQIQAKIDTNEQKIAQLKTSLDEVQARGGRGSVIRGQIQNIGRETDSLKRDLTVAQSIQNQVQSAQNQGQTVSESEQERVFRARSQAEQQGARISLVRSRVIENKSQTQPIPTQKQSPQPLGPPGAIGSRVGGGYIYAPGQEPQSKVPQTTSPIPVIQPSSQKTIPVISSVQKFFNVEKPVTYQTPPIKTETGQIIPSKTYQGQATRGYILTSTLEKPEIKLFSTALAATPAAIVRPIPTVIKGTKFFATSQRIGTNTELKVATKTTYIETGRLFPIARTKTQISEIKTIVTPEIASLSIGKTAELSPRVVLPSGTIRPFKNVENVASAGVGEQLGSVTRNIKFQNLKIVKQEDASAILVRSLTAKQSSFATENNVNAFVVKGITPERVNVVGGSAALRIKKSTGDLSLVIRNPNIKGTIVELPSESLDTGVKFLKPAQITKTPLKLTFSKQESLGNSLNLAQAQALKTPSKSLNNGLLLTGLLFSGHGGYAGVGISTLNSDFNEKLISSGAFVNAQNQNNRLIQTPSFPSPSSQSFPSPSSQSIGKQIQIPTSTPIQNQLPKIRIKNNLEKELSRERLTPREKLRTQQEQPTEQIKITITPPPITPPPIPPQTPPRPPPKIIPPTFNIAFPKLKPVKNIIPKSPKIVVQVRRFGTFKTVGVTSSLPKAINLGSYIVSNTLARTFRLKGANISNVPGFKTKREKLGLVFIEPSSKALNTPTELREISLYNFKKKKKRRKK